MYKKWLMVVLKASISGGLLWYAFDGIDLQTAMARLGRVDHRLFAFAMAGLAVQAGIGGLRWYAVAVAIETPLTFFTSIRLFYIGMFFSQALPGGTGGDAVRVYLAFRSGIPLRGAINGVLLERIVAVVALVLLVDLSQPFFTPLAHFETAGLIHTTAILISVATVAGGVFIMSLDRLPGTLQKWKIIRGAGFLAHDSRRVFLNLRHFVTVMPLGLLTHVNLSFVVYLMALGLDLQVTFLNCLILVPPVLLATTIPLSVGGWGVRESAMMVAFSLIGVPSEGALALSLLLGLAGLAISLPGGLVWLLSRQPERNVTLAKMTEELSTSST